MKSISELTKEEKSLMLAELMGWPMMHYDWMDAPHTESFDNSYFRGLGTRLCPYDNTKHGLAQFAAIFLRFPEVIEEIVRRETENRMNGIRVTQYLFLNEILIMLNKAKR